METNNMYHFHVAFYNDDSKLVLSGRTYKCETIVEAIELYVHDSNTPSMSRIKYVSCEQLMTENELKEIRIPKT